MADCYPQPVLDEGGACWLAQVAATIVTALGMQFATYADTYPDDTYGYQHAAADLDVQLDLNGCIVNRLAGFLSVYRTAFLEVGWLTAPDYTAIYTDIACIAYATATSNGGVLDFSQFLAALGSSDMPVLSPFLTAIGKAHWSKIYFQYALLGGLEFYNNYYIYLENCEACE